MKNITQQNHQSKEKVKQAINYVREKYQIRGKFTAADFYRICEAENIRLLNCEKSRALPQPKNIYGAIFTFHTGEPFIYLRSFFNRNRRICMKTAMHELGHYFLKHSGFIAAKMIIDGKIRGEQNEREAEYFAYLATKSEVVQ